MDNEQFKALIKTTADRQGFRPAIIEKDYHLTRILNAVNKHLSDDIIFKGGTLLSKVYLHYHRLSEDLDFSVRRGVDVSTRGKRAAAMSPIRKRIPAFLSYLGLQSNNPEGEGFNNSTQYLFNLQFDSVVTNRKEAIKLEVSLRQPNLSVARVVRVKHFYQDPFSGEDLFPQGSILALRLEECAAEKLKAAISRLTPAIRDYYDLKCFIDAGFDFARRRIIKMVNKKLAHDRYSDDYSVNLGLSARRITELKRSVKTNLAPVIKTGKEFELDEVLGYFNKLFSNI